jgi:hypothetical protein
MFGLTRIVFGWRPALAYAAAGRGWMSSKNERERTKINRLTPIPQKLPGKSEQSAQGLKE